MAKTSLELLREYVDLVEKQEEMIDDWCSSCYGEDPEMSTCSVCKGTGTNPYRKVVPPSKEDQKAWKKFKVRESRDFINQKGVPQFTLIDRDELKSFLIKRGFVGEFDEDGSGDFERPNGLSVRIDAEHDSWEIWSPASGKIPHPQFAQGRGEKSLMKALAKLKLLSKIAEPANMP